MKLELNFESHGIWHIGVVVNDIFVKYQDNQNKLIIDLHDDNNLVQLMFIGKEYLTQGENYCRITQLFINDLNLTQITENAVLYSDNPEYAQIQGCNYINLNGIWKITIDKKTVYNELNRILNA
jgi:hypothetical protein